MSESTETEDQRIARYQEAAKNILYELHDGTKGPSEAMAVLSSVCASVCLAVKDDQPHLMDEFLTQTLYQYTQLKKELTPAKGDAVH
jgi:hypothetical protein